MRRKSRVRRSETAGVDSRRLNPSDGWLKFLPLPSMPGHAATEENRLFSIKNRLITNPEVTVGTV